MAVQKRKKSRARRDMRRSHNRGQSPAHMVDPVTGELHRRHHITKTGYYRGKKVVDIQLPVEDEEEEADS